MSIFDLRRTVEKSLAGGQTLMTALEEIRMRIVLSRGAIVKLQQAPVSVDEAHHRLDDWIASISASSAVVSFAARFTSPSHRLPVSAVPPELVSAAVCGTLRDLIIGKISESYGSAKGLSAADRARQIEKAGRELLELELAEEAIIRSAEHNGIDVLRRLDADPRAVLCHGDFLK
ncbi:hypothetical protein SRABI05_00633 [Agrobacterium fabrum]|uniref:hypothetical protein n=1 Tax=Agrobacterium fabrum TaxID=1176649 RepID=UPI001D7F545E|nr:hypothetical protein [Agrobacterium fabrum]CAH0154642.1 hypothetical protein SRABI05_00633 [Agrobacterium fabrum]CAH0174168.1 hypothetical protein SRABI46_01347 [Agrobacterium fabrum]